MNVSAQVHAYIRQRQAVRDCLEHDLINYSALARHICEELQITSFEAVLMACRRFPKGAKRQARDKTIKALLRRAKIVLRTKMVVATVEKRNALPLALNLQQLIKRSNGDFRLIEGEETFSIVCNDEYLHAVTETFGAAVRDISKGLTQISMVFPQQITTTIGVSAYMYRILAEHGINIRDEMSCWTDVMIVVAEKDATKAIGLLQE